VRAPDWRSGHRLDAAASHGRARLSAARL